jgi:hypothetical protein
MTPPEAYEAGRLLHGRTVEALDARARGLGAARLCVAAAACILVGVIVWAPLQADARRWAWAGLAGAVIAFVTLVVIHARVHDAARLARAALRFHERGLRRLARAWDELPTTSLRFASAGHPYTSDLDIFGRASVMQLVDATETRLGEERLAHLLSLEGADGWPEKTRARQDAARDLAGRFAFREQLATRAGVVPPEDRREIAAVLRWGESQDPAPGAVAWLAWVLPAAAVAVMGFGPAVGLSVGWVVTIVVAEMALGHLLTTRLVPALETVSDRLSAVTQWRSTIECVEGEPLEAPLLDALRKRLWDRSAGASRASDAIKRLERIVGFTDARRNEAFRFFFGPVLMWDAHCALALMRWRARSGAQLRGWVDTLGEIEALASLGSFAFEHADFAWPALETGAIFEAQGLGHPLIADARRVGNDVRFASGAQAIVITGSNMSGKSTFLRAIGVNAVLAAAGAPVSARSLRIGPLRVASSMRIDDSLEEGVSHFYAELRRLKAIVDRARVASEGRSPASVLFLLDEILHGTNSRERVIGAAAVVRDLLAHGALGGVSTHDVGITALEREMGDRVQNAHFEEQVDGETMTFDYVLRPGIVQSSNALRLMRAVGIDVPDESRTPG